MLQLRLTPGEGSAGGPRTFIVRAFEHHLDRRTLTLVCRDGHVGIQLVGHWHLEARPSSLAPHTVDEVARIHDETPAGLVLVG